MYIRSICCFCLWHFINHSQYPTLFYSIDEIEPRALQYSLQNMNKSRAYLHVYRLIYKIGTINLFFSSPSIYLSKLCTLVKFFDGVIASISQVA